MKIFITATSGVGKTAVIEELAKRGYTAYDADDRNLKLTRLEIKDTGEPAEWPLGFVDWHYYSWNAKEDGLKELLKSNETVVIAGQLGNQENFYPYFDKLITLTIDPTEHERRLRARPKRNVGDDERNIQRRLETYSKQMEQYIASGFVPVDNSTPVKETVDQILKVIS